MQPRTTDRRPYRVRRVGPVVRGPYGRRLTDAAEPVRRHQAGRSRPRAAARVTEGMTRTLARMLGSARVVAFVSAVDLDRARAFYEGILGLTVEEVNDFACVLRGGGTMLRVTKVDHLTPQPFTVLGWAVDDIHAIGAALRQRGVEFLRYE